jgi:tRNA(Ile)-lysidine synthase
MGIVKRNHLQDWVWSFCVRHGLLRQNSKVLIGLSGGQDSMLLGSVFFDLYKKGYFNEIIFIHIDHGLRPESSIEAAELAKWCSEHEWPLIIEKFSGDIPESNIELWARNFRKDLFSKYRNKLGSDAVVLLGHHIDDSFEWYMRQLLGSSSGEQTFGIPVKNGFYRRPFHCLTRKQIEFWVNRLNLFYINDSSNNDLKFERNFIRHKIKNELLNKFPKGLAHFCERGNDWARKSGLSCNNIYSSNSYSPHNGTVFLYQLDGRGFFDGQSNNISEVIKLLSSKERGELRQNIKKLINAQKNGKRGPLNFSGGVSAFSYPGLIIFCNKIGLKNMAMMDLDLSKIIDNASQIPDGLRPFKINKTKMVGLSSLKSDPLFPLTCQSVAHKGWWIRPHSHILLKIS